MRSWLPLAASLGLAACQGTIGEPGNNAVTGTGASTGAGGTQTAGAGGMVASGTGGSTGGPTGTGGGPLVPPPPVLVPTARLARLSHLQWAQSARDLLKLADVSEITEKVSGDAVVGLDNEIDSLYVSPQLRSDLEAAAQALATRVVGDAAALARLVPAGAPTDLAGKARAFIAGFGLRAYRRPLTDAEVTDHLALFNQGPTLYPGTDAFAAGANLVLQAFLQSPHFLYRTELGTQAVGGRIALSDYEVAAKLSLALTNTIPDDALAAAAAAGQLHTAAAVSEQAARLLATPAGADGRDHLHFQIYRLGAYDGITRDTAVFPKFTPATPAAMRQEVLLFLRSVFDQGGGVREIFTAPFTFVNASLAPLYGLSGTFTTAFTKIDLPATQRGGILTQPGFLSQYAVVNDPDTIRRGVFINTRVLCVKLPPPDPNAGALVPLSTNMTNRERVEATTGPGTCGAGCHSTVINPPGFAYEAFDAVGSSRTTDRDKPINAASSYAFNEGIKSFDGAVAFNELLATSSQAHACYVRNWKTYVDGRPAAVAEQPRIDYLTQLSLAGQLSVKDLILTMVTDDGFLNRLP